MSAAICQLSTAPSHGILGPPGTRRALHLHQSSVTAHRKAHMGTLIPSTCIHLCTTLTRVRDNDNDDAGDPEFLPRPLHRCVAHASALLSC
eukprot:scaffold208461_cov17-Tisochrysis_lutea.AAC.2